MKRTIQCLAILLAATTCTGVAIAAPATNAVKECGPVATTTPAHEQRTIEVAFVLDTTGSMSGLIEGAKHKIWTIANSIVTAEKGARVKFALVPYRDRGDAYVTKIFDLTDDIDKVYADLQSFKADGGGDGPESVNQALHDAVNSLAWSTSGDVRKFIFLVGDAPPHMDYSDDVKFPDTCQSAAKKGLIVNTIQCGNSGDTRETWQKIASLAEGSFVALEQSGGMKIVETPHDKEIADLGAKIAKTTIAYGDAPQQASVANKTAAAVAAPAAVAADRATFNVNTGNKAVQGRGDLVADVRENAVTLDEIPKDQLPPELRDLPRDQQLARLNDLARERDALSKQVHDLAQKRQAYIEEQNKKQTGKGDAFDAKVSEIVQTQMNRK